MDPGNSKWLRSFWQWRNLAGGSIEYHDTIALIIMELQLYFIRGSKQSDSQAWDGALQS